MLTSYISKGFNKTLFPQYLFFYLMFFVLLNGISFLLAGDTYAGQTTLSWTAPTTYSDGTPLTDLAGYKVYYGTASGAYTQNINVGNVITYTVPNLTDGGTYYFAVTAYDSASTESGYSNELSKMIGVSQQYTLTVYRGGTGSGNVTSSPSGISCGTNCAAAYNSGTAITLTATPDASSTFAGWSGACTGTGSCSVTMSAATSVTATFTLKTNTITASAGTGGSISPSGSVSVNYGANQSFSITANSGYSIAAVTVDGTSAGAVSTYTFSNVTTNHTISATFAVNSPSTYGLTVSKTGTGAGTITSSPSGISCGSSCSYSYNSGTAVTLTAAPDASSTFVGWSGACTGTGTCSVTMSAAKSVTATFTLKTYTITASAVTGGTISPSGTVSVNYGANQSFTITANAGYSVANVLVDGSSAGAVSTYAFSNVTANHTISATFATNTYGLSVAKAGTGAGTITSSPAGISCGSSCSYSYNSGTAVTLTAAPDASSTFAGWSGACTGTGTCSVTMSAAKSVTATFTLKTYTITASAVTGGTISPSGTVSVNYGANQTFTITANAGYSIANVLVDGSSAGAVSTYAFSNVTANHTISATFATNTYGLSVTKAGAGAGTITSSPAGISCGSSCSYSYSPGSAVILTATPDASSTFAGWSGTCSGAGNCIVTMDAAKSVAANFALKTYTINASAGTGGTISPSGSVSVNNGANQSFTITATTGYSIGNVIVDGSSVGTAASYSFTNVAANHSISASFTAGSDSSASGLPKTGQTYSYAVGDDGYTQAGTNWPNPRFTDNGDGTVTDNLTGLMWLKNGSCLKAKWTTALQNIASWNSGAVSCQGYTGNYSDWRLPDVKEIESLINYGQSNSATWLNSAGFINIRYSNYWSSTTYQGGTSNAWTVNMNNGAEVTGSKSYSYYVLPVRSVSSESTYAMPKTGQTVSYASGDDGYIEAGSIWPSARFTDNGDGTMTDNMTGLMWLKDAGCLSRTWSSAFTVVAGLGVNPGGYNCLGYAANYSDWRLPNVNEIESLINFGAANSASWLSSQGFMNVKSSYYWSSTTYQNNTSQAWGIQMTKGQTSALSKRYSYSAWPVRTGNLK